MVETAEQLELRIRFGAREGRFIGGVGKGELHEPSRSERHCEGSGDSEQQLALP